MTEPLDRVGLPSRSTDSHGRTDGRTNEEATHLEINPSPNASRAGGLDDSAAESGAARLDDDLHYGQHDHSPHVYVVYWPEIATIKVGITEAQERWEWWTKRGAVLIATAHTCCMDHARRIERYMLGILSQYGARAFASEEAARFALGRKRGGYTECYRLVQSSRKGWDPLGDYDWESAYGLILPAEFEACFETYDFAIYPTTDAWQVNAS